MPKTPPPESRKRRFLKYHLPLIVYALAIIAVSAIPNLRPPKVTAIPFDKVAHFVEYAIFAFLAFRSFTNIDPHIRLSRAVLLSALFITLFALLDETLQQFIPGRHYDLLDYAVDVAGAFIVLILLGLHRHKTDRNKA